jgi:hypothetical protein
MEMAFEGRSAEKTFGGWYHDPVDTHRKLLYN